MRRKWIICGFFIAFTVIGSGAFATPYAPNDKPDMDTAIKTMVEHRLEKHHLLKGNQIEVTVENGQITLDGTVTTLAQKRQAAQDARHVEDDYRIVNNLTLKPSNLSDKTISNNVRQALDKHIFYDVYDWYTEDVNNGVVTLNGWVHEPWRKAEFEKIVEGVPGVVKIKNEMDILPLSSLDDQLRHEIFRAIYTDPMFQAYGVLVNPPIHIIVDQGKVYLEGKVNSESERLEAGEATQSVADAFLLINDLSVSE